MKTLAYSLVLSASFASSALAQTPTVVLDFEGPGASRIRQMAIRGLQSHVDLTDRDAFNGAAGSMSSDSDYAAGAAAAGVNAIVEGRVERDGRNFVATISVRGGDGAMITEMQAQNRNANRLGNDVRRQIWRDLGDAIENAPPPQQPEPDEPDEPLDPVSGGGGQGAVVVLAFDGPGADTARDAVIESLEAAGLDVSRGDAADASERVEEARENGARALVGGTVSRSGRSLETTVVVYNGGDGESLGEETFEGRNANAMLDEIRGSLWSNVGSMIERGEVPEGDDEGGGDDSGPSGPRPYPLIVGAYLRVFNRDFSYNDDLAVLRPGSAEGLREYSLPLGPALELEATWYPLAHFMGGFAANIGIDGTFTYAFGIESSECRPNRNAQGLCEGMAGTVQRMEIAFPTSSLSYSIGARVRFPVDIVEPYLQVAFGGHSFRIEALNVTEPKPEVPDVDYSFLRLGGGARFQFGPVIVEPRLAYLLLLGTGQFEEADWFPHSSGGAFEAMLRLGVEIVEFLEVHASFNYQQYGFSMNNEVGDNVDRVAGGALDRYIGGSLGVALKIPGSEGDAGYSEE
jgi:hypothetical protein